MSTEERRRVELFERLVDALGEEAAATMSELLPPAGRSPASQDSVDALAADMTISLAHVGERFSRMEERLDGIDQRLDGIDHRLDGIDQRLDGIDHRLDGIDHRLDGSDQRLDGIDQRLDGIDHRLETVDVRLDALRHELVAAFRGELVTAVSGQTRSVIVATATATFGIGGLAVTLAQLL